MNPMFNRVLILSASAGAGHLRAADALEKAFHKLGAAREVRHVDTLKFTTNVFRKLYSDAYLKFVDAAPDVLGWLYDRLDKPDADRRLTQAFTKFNVRPFEKMLREHEPDLFVCTHFLPAEIIARLRRKGRVDAPFVLTVTDFDVHAMWLTPGCDHYFVAIEETRIHLATMGVPENQITVTGIPIDPLFAQRKDKAEMRRKHGLDPALTTILISAGGFGVGPIENLLTSLATLKHRAQVVAIAGRNADLRARLEKRFASPTASANVRFHITGYTTEMDEFMSASDLIVGKPGGLTTSESLAKGLVMVVVNPIPGQEERNSDHLLEEGAAIRCNNLPALAYKIDKLLDEPARLDAMRRAAAKLGRPESASDVVRALLKRFDAAEARQ